MPQAIIEASEDKFKDTTRRSEKQRASKNIAY